MLKLEITRSEMDQIEKFSPDLKTLVEMVEQNKIEIRLKGGTAKFILAYLWQVRPELQAKWSQIATIPNLTDLDGSVKINDIELHHNFPEHLVQDFRFDDTGWYTSPSHKVLRAQLNGLFATMMGVDSPIGEIALFGKQGDWWFMLGDGFAWDINPYRSKLPPFKEWKDVEYRRKLRDVRARWSELYWEIPLEEKGIWRWVNDRMGMITHQDDLFYEYRTIMEDREEEWKRKLNKIIKRRIPECCSYDEYWDEQKDEFKSILRGWIVELSKREWEEDDLWHFPRYGWRIGDKVNESQWKARSLVFQERYKLKSDISSLDDEGLKYAIHKKLKLKDLLKKGIITLELYKNFKEHQEEEKEEKNEEDKYWDEARRWFPGEGY
jgi:hypothetical protein